MKRKINEGKKEAIKIGLREMRETRKYEGRIKEQKKRH